MSDATPAGPVARFDRRFFEGVETFTEIGSGAIGGKASGLRRARAVLDTRPPSLRFEGIEVSVPTLTVLGTDVFDAFVDRNDLRAFAAGEPPDHQVARRFQQAELPTEIAGDLWDLVRRVHTPLAVRSSSLLEDALEHPFAGVYGTKMTPNDALDSETRFHRLVEAIKFVWASAFFPAARAAVRAAGHDPDREKMAVIVQEVVGRRHHDRFYPDVACVARSINFYPSGSARREEGVSMLALGLGKTIVDGGRTWTYSPASPSSSPPFNSIPHLLEEAQASFWAVRMGPPPEYDPTAEVEYLERYGLAEAEADGTLAWTASTYDAERDRIVLGTGPKGARVLNFAPLLQLGDVPFNDAVKGLLDLFASRTGSPVEIELALTLPEEHERPARLGFLQVRAMALQSETVEVSDALVGDPAAVVHAEHVLGNGIVRGIRDIAFVKREGFDASRTSEIVAEIESLNRSLVRARRPYLLIGFGRWGSTEPWLGIPVTWAAIGGARTIVEAEIAGLHAEMSQGAHFFHNLLGFGIPYFSVSAAAGGHIDWDWLESRPPATDGPRVRHVALEQPLEIRVDGRRGRGVVLRREGGPGA